MSHHAESDSEFPETLKKFTDEISKVARQVGAGPTGEFPRGQIHRTDEGAIRMAVTIERGTIILAFGKPVAWVGMSRIEACELADMLKKKAAEL